MIPLAAANVEAGATGSASGTKERDDGSPMPLVELSDIAKNFGGVHALRGVHFDLLPGEVHALLGQNGAGKSTLIKVLSGVIQKDQGRIQIGGEEVEFRTPAASRAAGVAVVYQELSLVPSMSVAANIFLSREPHRLGIVDRQRMHRATREFLDAHGFALDPRAIVADLPFAYRQLTEIAKALIGNVKILVLDEPTSSLSGGEEATLFDAIAQVRKKGVGVIYVTHRLSEVFRLSQRVTVLRDGLNVGTYRTSETDMGSLVGAIIGTGKGAWPVPPPAAVVEAFETALGGRDTDARPPAGADRPPVSASAGRPPILELRDVTNERLHGVRFSVAAGEVVGLAGMMGSGRTEILETIFGLRRVASGELLIDGRPVVISEPMEAIRRGIALVPEDRHAEGLILDHSVERNVALPRLAQLGRFGFFRRRTSHARAWDAIRELSIKAPSPLTPVRALSGGNQQKIVFGKWREPAPSVLLLDEPTVGVDVGARDQIYRLIRAAAGRGTAVIVVSSELGELIAICDRIGIVVDGRIATEVSRAEVRNEEHLHTLVQEATA